MRLLLTADAVGGVWQYATDLARALAPHGAETVLAMTGPSPTPAQVADAAALPATRLIDTGLALDWLAATPEEVHAASIRLAALAADVRADIVQLNAPALAAGARFPCPVLAVAHSSLATWWAAVEGGTPPADFAWRDALTRDGLLAADLTIAPSRAHARATAEAHDLPFEPVAIHNGRTPFARPAGDLAPHAFTAGRLWDRGKNLAVLDRAAAGVPILAAGPMVGPHGEQAAFDHLTPLGWLDDAALAAHLAARPVFVSAARYEPFGLAVLEAAKAGCALVLADIPTFRELWDGAAIFVAADDADGFAQAIAALLADPATRQTAGDQARTQSARFTVESMAAAYMDNYRHLLARDRRSAA